MLAGSTAAAGMNAEGSIATMGAAAFGNITGAINELSQTDRAVAGNLLTAGVAGLVANAVGGGNAQFIERETGLTLNKNQQLLFNGVTGRDFSFNWDIVPRSKKEAEQVKVIIRILKQSMSAQRGRNKNSKRFISKISRYILSDIYERKRPTSILKCF
mgnify:CR=1 FL=1